MSSRDDSFPCPVCGAEVPVRARACPSCGADERTGWRDDLDDADLPAGYEGEDDFDYEDFVRREFGHTPPAQKRRRLALAIGAVVLLLLLVYYLLGAPGL